MTNRLRGIPAVEKVLQALGAADLPRPMVVAVVRRELGAVREEETVPEFEALVVRVRSAVDQLRRSRIQPVINATGIVIHTNLGRSPLPSPALRTLQEIGGNYNNLEFDVTTGERGGRAAYLEEALAILCEAEAATVVNNCAAALVLALHHFTREKAEVVISRGELIQIGGGFRVPEILEASGARLREVGTTNKTNLSDYERAINEQTGLILKVHRSNFYMGGFVESPATAELGELARSKGIPFVEDLGSGAAIRTESITGLPHEPTPAEVLQAGVDLVAFSGDKLFGGPQAGILAGRHELVQRLKKDPFFRAVRCDKLILSALQTMADIYLSGSGDLPPIPAIESLNAPLEVLKARAERMLLALAETPAKITIGKGKSEVGGGTLPQAELESVTLDILPTGLRLEDLSARLCLSNPPVIGYIGEQRLRLDLRTIFPHQDQLVITAVRDALEA